MHMHHYSYMVTVHVYEVQIYYTVCGVLKMQLKLAVVTAILIWYNGGRFGREGKAALTRQQQQQLQSIKTNAKQSAQSSTKRDSAIAKRPTRCMVTYLYTKVDTQHDKLAIVDLELSWQRLWRLLYVPLWNLSPQLEKNCRGKYPDLWTHQHNVV